MSRLGSSLWHGRDCRVTPEEALDFGRDSRPGDGSVPPTLARIDPIAYAASFA